MNLNKSNICSHYGQEIAYNGNKLIQHVRNQYGKFHNACWPMHKAACLGGLGRK